MDEKGAGTAGWQSSSSLRIYRLLCVVKKKKFFLPASKFILQTVLLQTVKRQILFT